MLEREVKVGQVYRHFKGSLHRVLYLAKDSESLVDIIVYSDLDDGSIWIRSKEMFLSNVDKKKYPNVKQDYRFELVEEGGN